MVAGIISGILLALWLVLALMGKGGFVHLLLVASVCVGMVEVMAVYRARATEADDDQV